MVMKRSAMAKNLRQSILKSLGRYLAISAIIALGAGMFVGLVTTKTDMIATGQQYMDTQNMFDLRLISSYGWAQEQLDEVALLDMVEDAEGLQYLDVIATKGESTQESVYRFYAIPQRINLVSLQGGRMPESPDECLVDAHNATDKILGTTIHISDGNAESTLDAVAFKTYTVVGYVYSPLYMDINRGTTSVGNGSIANFIYIPSDGFNLDYYSEIHVTLAGEYPIYSNAYNQAMEAAADQLEPLLEPLAQERLEQVKADGEEAYQSGLDEYKEGFTEYLDSRDTAKKELAEAEQKLKDGARELDESEKLLADGEQMIADGEKTLDESEKMLLQSRQTLAKSKADAYSQLAEANRQLLENYKTVNASLQQVNSGILQLQTGLIQLNSGITQLENGLSQIDNGISQIDTVVSIMDTSISSAEAALEVAKNNPETDPAVIEELEGKLQEFRTQRDQYIQQKAELEKQREEYNAQLQELYAQRTELEGQLSELQANKETLDSAMTTINSGLVELQGNQSQMENQFASAEAQLEAGELQLKLSREQLAQKKQETADGKTQLEEGRKELEDGWKEYRESKEKVEAELAEGKQKLADAKLELDDARRTLDEMTENKVFVLDRSSNIGYNSLDSSSDIMEGVSRVFPAFFLLVAALVCITTMTRMIDEERTQIGTLKALGYGNGQIISKYLLYAGSGAVLGCGVGVLLGSMVFPTILWEAYKIMLCITPRIVLKINWHLCGLVITVYTGVMLLVTWYCCRRSLEEEPAELIRPKAPAAGKKVFLERLRFWNKIGFLNKVSIRNIFRYRQRLAMMLVGIGGCTALLLTGFGIRDSIVDVVDIQFDEVTIYDVNVNFSQGIGQKEKQTFLNQVNSYAEDVLFYYQSSVELDADNKTREIYLISAEERIKSFQNLRKDGQELPMPGVGEVLLSVGVAEDMGIREGDTVRLRNADMEVLDLTVSGIYTNHVYNYAIVIPETLEAQWGYTPDDQMAMVMIADGMDVHEAGANISKLDNVVNITVNQDLAKTVSSMMSAMDYVVLLVVVCAATLAVIVVYNLTNININERIREIATIKVLGFNASETAAYVFKENLALSVMGAAVGLLGGKLLLLFVMSQIKINMVWFTARANAMSFVLAVVLTLVAACLVDLAFFFRIEKINMAEALKSVE